MSNLTRSTKILNELNSFMCIVGWWVVACNPVALGMRNVISPLDENQSFATRFGEGVRIGLVGQSTKVMVKALSGTQYNSMKYDEKTKTLQFSKK